MPSLDFILDLRDAIKSQGLNFILISSQKNKDGKFINHSYIDIQSPDQLTSVLDTLHVDLEKLINEQKMGQGDKSKKAKKKRPNN